MAKASATTGSTTDVIHTRTTAGSEESQVVVLGEDGTDNVAALIARGAYPTAGQRGLAVMSMTPGKPTYQAVTADITMSPITAAGLQYALTLWHPSTSANEVRITEIGANFGILQTAGRFAFEVSFISAENATPGGTLVTPQPLSRADIASGTTVRAAATAAPTLAGSLIQRAVFPLPAAAAPHVGSGNAGYIIFSAPREDDAIVLRASTAEGVTVRSNVIAALTTAPIYNLYVRYTERP